MTNNDYTPALVALEWKAEDAARRYRAQVFSSEAAHRALVRLMNTRTWQAMLGRRRDAAVSRRSKRRIDRRSIDR